MVQPAGIPQDESIVTPILETATADVAGEEALAWRARVVKPGPLEWEFDHCGFGSVLIPGVTYLEAALEASLRLHGPGLHVLSDVRFHTPLFLGDARECTLHTAVLDAGAYTSTVVVKSCVDEQAAKPLWQRHATITVHKSREPYADVGGFETDARAILARCPTAIDGAAYYDGLWARGLQLGPAFRSMRTVHIGARETLTEMCVPAHLRVADYVFVPPVLDAAMQCIGAALLADSDGIRGIYLPHHMDRLLCWHRPPPRFYVHVTMREPPTSRALLADVHAFAADGTSLLHIDGFQCNYVEDARNSAGLFYEQQWKPVPAHAPRATLSDVPALLFANTRRSRASSRLARELRQAGQLVYAIARDGEGTNDVKEGIKGEEEEEDYYRTAGDSKEAMEQVIQKVLDDHRKALAAKRAAEAASGTPEAAAAAMAAAATEGEQIRRVRVVYAWTLDCRDEADLEGASLVPFVHLANALQGLPEGVTVQLWVVTAGGRCVRTGEDVDPCQSAIWGMAGIVTQEYAQIKVVSCDLSLPVEESKIEGKEEDKDKKDSTDSTDPHEISHLAGEIISSSAGEDQLCMRGAETLACRLVAAADPACERVVQARLGEQRCRLEITKPGSLDSLALVAQARPATLEPDEVEVEVRAAALNFRDVMRAMGLYPAEDDTPAVGLEAAGVVLRVGRAVQSVAPGDAVIAVGAGAFGTHVVVPEACCVRKPEGWSFAEAAAATGVLMTAHVALVWVARVARGESVLVHSATGGVGLAALQVCRAHGCEVYATCGRAEKRAYLVAHEGVAPERVHSSRSVAFAGAVRAQTGGRGVDVVLNSLMGEGLLRSLELLAPQGRFVEIGKRDIYDNTPVGLRPFAHNALLASVAVDEYFKRNRPYAHRLLAEVVGLMAAGTYRPIPHTAYALPDAVRAFRHMASATHIGKIVVTVDPAQTASVTLRAPAALRPDATYVVAGLGGMGAALVEWLLARGARAVAALSPLRSAGSRAQVDELTARAQEQHNGAVFRAFQCDLADEARVRAIITEEIARAGLPAVRGVVHAAGVVADELLGSLTEPALNRVLAPKVRGAHALDAATRSCDLDFFVCFSSVASLMGTAGQASYAAANAYVDGLAAARRAAGRPAIALNWGPVALGMTARLPAPARAAMQAQGLALLARGDYLAQLAKVLFAADPASLPPQRAVLRADWGRWAAQHPALRAQRRFAALVRAAGAHTVAGRVFLQALFARRAPAARLALVTEALVRNIAGVLAIPAAGFPVDRPLTEMGLDSMVANEVRVRIEQEVGIPMSIAALIGGPPVSKLARSLLAQIEALGKDAALGSGDDDETSGEVDGDESSNTESSSSTESTETPILNEPGSLSLAVDLTPADADLTLPPVFAVCPAGGQAPIFAPLAARLRRRFVALQRASGACDSLRDLARAHARVIRRACPQGPCTLVGHSLGAVVAYEVASILLDGDDAMGKGDMDNMDKNTTRAEPYVESLVMLDPVNSETARAHGDALEMAMLLCALGRARCAPDTLAAALAGRTGDARWEQFFAACRVPAAERRAYRLAVADIAAEVALFDRHEFARPAQPVPYRLGIALAAHNHPRAVQLLRTDRSVAAWSLLTRAAQVAHASVDGDHWSILAEPHVDALAKTIVPWL